jgi:hypothetical protein
MPRFRKRPVEIEAIQYTGDNYFQVWDWALQKNGAKVAEMGFADTLVIMTLEGTMRASPGDWIIKGVDGEFYPCKPDIFAKTYDPLDGCGYCVECKERCQ